jgi:serine phosphatase RsbU (regulator of sigma subunit)
LKVEVIKTSLQWQNNNPSGKLRTMNADASDRFLQHHFIMDALLVCILLFVLMPVFGQTGIPYITHFESREGYENYNWSVCQDDHNTMLFANKKGLKSYDGSEWRYIEVPHVPLMIKKHPKTGVVYILSTNTAGYLQRDHKGIRQYIPILDEGIHIDNPSNILFTDNLVVFHGAQTIQGYDVRDHQPKFKHKAEPGERYSGAVSLEGALFVLIRNQGISRVEKDTLIQTGIGPPDGEDEILFSLDHSDNEIITGMRSGNLLVFNGKGFTPFPMANSDYLVQNELADGLVLNDSTYLFSTLYGGAVLVNSMNGKVINTINYESGLPDDEIYAIGVDNYQGIWITYRFGISRLDPNLPVRDFSSYPGLEGLLTGVLSYNNILYVSTTTGLYRLSEVKYYEDVIVYIKNEQPVIEKTAGQQKEVEEKTIPQPEEEAEEQEEIMEKEEKQGFFRRLFSRRSKEAEEVEQVRTGQETDVMDEREAEVAEPDYPSEENPEGVVVQRPKYIKKTISRLKSSEFVYQKIEGITSNCQQMIATPNGILAGTSAGLYLINNGQAELIDAIRNINFISERRRNSYLVTSDSEIIKVTRVGDRWKVGRELLPLKEPFFSACETDSLTIWASGLDVVYRMSRNKTGSDSIKKFDFKSLYPEEFTLSMINDTLFLFSESMIQYYLPSADSFLIYDPFMENEDFSSLRLFPSASGDFWIRMDYRMFPFSKGASSYKEGYEIFSLFKNVSSFHSNGHARYWIIDDYSRVFLVNLSEQAGVKYDFDIFLEQITNEQGEYISLNAPVFDPSENMVTLRLTAPYFLKDNSTQYQYLIEDRMEQWSEWNSESSVQLITGPGDYRIMVRARNILGGISNPAEIAFTIQPPFYRTSWFYVILIPVILGLLFLIIFIRERKLKRDKLLLEQKIEERTREIQVQKEQIENQKNKILAQKNDITSSITYASKIQNAVLPDKKLFDRVFKDYFIFYRPRDIVSGDFYWITHNGKKTIFTVADCTGHGVPGAFMSMLGNSFLNEIIRTNSISLSSDQILNQLRDKISEALAQSGEQSSTHDGMDIALCIYDWAKSEIQFSGAYNSLYLVRDGKLVTVKGDMMPIGYYPSKKDFTSYSITINKGDILYLFSDGFADQFGGPKDKKYTIGRFKKLLVSISDQPMEEQRRTLDTTLKSWGGDNIQVDDVLVMGVKF